MEWTYITMVDDEALTADIKEAEARMNLLLPTPFFHLSKEPVKVDQHVSRYEFHACLPSPKDMPGWIGKKITERQLLELIERAARIADEMTERGYALVSNGRGGRF